MLQRAEKQLRPERGGFNLAWARRDCFRPLGFALPLTLIAGFLTMPLANADPANSKLGKKIESAFDAGELPGLHGVLVQLRDKVLAEVYFDGQDERWGQKLSDQSHGPDTLHDLRSVTKSIVSLLYGIALADGVVPPLDESILTHFPQYSDLTQQDDRRQILIREVLSMKMGTQWDESLPYSDPRNSEIAMELSPDRYRYVLDRPMVREPGEEWVYNGGAVALIGKLISDGAGMPLDEYAKEKLFTPLGIEHFDWIRGADGIPSAASGLRLTLRDLAKIGRLVAQKGVYKDTRIVPEDWLKESFVPRSDIDGGEIRYGYFWWLSGRGTPPSWVAGFGNGGQRLTVAPKTGLVVVVFAGNYNQPDAWQIPVRIIEQFVVPALDQE
jgi:CubicO group peptidase (beta-lactamase class C family)